MRQQAARLRERIDEDRKQFDAQRTKLAAERAEILALREESESARAEVAQTRERFDAERQQLSAERDQIANLETETKNQRRRIAREFQVQHATHLAELERRRVELQALAEASQSDLAEHSTSQQREIQELNGQLAQLRKVLNGRAEELNQLRTESAQQNAEIQKLRAAHDRLAEDLVAHDSAAGADGEQLALLRAERDELARKLAEPRPANAETDEKTQARLDEMQRRFELAVEDVRDLKRRNADLESRLANAPAGGAAASSHASGGLDWESQKRRLLAALEADEDNESGDDEDVERRREERVSIASTISITDRVLDEKDREIADLKQLLGEQSSNLGSLAVGAQAVAAIFDQDELIRQEREKLARLQDECKEGLRQAEIDISLERAKITRDRAEIDELVAGLKADAADRLAAGEPPGEPGKPAKPVRGRWLARLGLKDTDE